MHGLFTAAQRALIDRVDRLVAEKIAPRAADYDRTGEFAVADFEDIHREGLLLATLPKKDGGLGFGFNDEDPLSYFLIIERLARGSASTAHCFQVHCNATQMMRRFGSDEQIARFLQPTRERALLLVGAAAEPGGTRDATLAKRVPGGYRVTGRKHYATNATHAKWISAHIRADDTGRLENMVIDTASPGLTIDAAFWNAPGMRSCISPMLIFEDCFVPEDCILRRPDAAPSGAFLTEHWPAKINLGFTANYLGNLQAMLEWSTGYAKQRGPVTDSVYLSQIGELRTRIDASRLLFYHAISLLKADTEAGLVMGLEAKWMAVETLNRFIELVGQFVGSTAFFTQYPLDRMIRDMQQHSLHRRHHPGALVIAHRELGQDFDINKS